MVEIPDSEYQKLQARLNEASRMALTAFENIRTDFHQ